MGHKARLHPFKVEAVTTKPAEYIPEGVQMIHAPEQWDAGKQGQNVVVAIIDTGVDYNHPDLKDNIIGGKDFTGKSDYMDGNGHGTHVAGTIAATNSGSGIVGVAPMVKILALKALDDQGSGSMDDVIAAINYAVAQKVNIISMSLGGPGSTGLHDAVIAAYNAGIIVVCAAGNEGDNNPNTEELSYPGAYHEVIEVGAVDYNGNLAYFSNTNHEVDILAPGVDIYSTYPGGTYAKLSGTSMATPHMSGAVALLKSNNVADYTHGDYILNVGKVADPKATDAEPDLASEEPIPAPQPEVPVPAPVPAPAPGPAPVPAPGPAPVAPIDPVVPGNIFSFLRMLLDFLRKLFGGK